MLKPRDSTVKYGIFKPPTLEGRRNPTVAPEEPEETEDRAALLEGIRAGRELQKRLYRGSLFAYAKFCLGYDLINPEVHGQLCTTLENAYWGVDCPDYAKGSVRRILLLLPRGSFKSTIATMSFPSWILLQNDPPSLLGESGALWTPPASFNGKMGYDQRILIANEVEKNAKAFLKTNKDHLAGNQGLIDVFGKAAPEKRVEGLWTASMANVTWRQDYRTRDANLTATALDMAVNSGHFDFGIYDDLISQKQVTTGEQIEQSIRFYREQLPLLDKPSVMVVIGTRWHDRDLYGHFLESDEEKNKWEVIIERAERTEEEIEAGKSRFFFPDLLGETVLHDLRTSMRPDFFSAQYQNECLDPETQVFKTAFFDNSYYNVPRDPESRASFLRGKTIISTADPAISQEKRGCYAVITTCAWDHQGRCWILDLFRKQGVHTAEFIFEYFRQFVEWQPIKCGIEQEGFQKMYRYNFELVSLGNSGPEFEQFKGVWPSWEPLKPGGRSKDLRISGLEPVCRASKLKIPEEFKIIEAEFTRFPKGRYKDTLDALAYQMDLAYPGEDLGDGKSDEFDNLRVLERKEWTEEYARHRRKLCAGGDMPDDWYNG